jgi:hypothetical protein
MMLLDRTPSFVPGLGIAVLAVTAAIVPVLAIRATGRTAQVQLAAAALGLAMLLAAPAAYAVDTMQTAYSGGTPAAGPASTGADGGFGSGGPGGQASFGGNGGQSPAGAANGRASFGGGPGGSGLDTATLDYLVANQGSATWLVAVSDSTSAGQVELATGRAVMSIGGFTGSDNALTLAQLKAYVASGRLRFVEVGGQGGGPQGGSSSAELSSWVTSACTAVTAGGTTSASVYDCSTATGG